MGNFISATFLDWLTDNREAFGAGPGLYCPLHIALIVIMAVWLIGFSVLAFKKPAFAKKFGAVLAILMVVFRLARMIIMVASGRYTFAESLPWHLCHIMCFALCIIYFIKPTRFSLPILCLSVLGGIMTFLFGDYYYASTITFFMVESIFLHFCLPTVVICYLASRRPKYTIFSVIEVPIVLAVLCGWASIGNAIFPDQNFMFLKQNGLPFNFFPGHSFYFTYLVVGVIIIALVAAVYVCIRLAKKKKSAKKTEQN